MRLGANRICQIVLIFLAIFLIFQIMCNKKSLFGGDAKEEVKVQETESTNLESDDSELEYNDPDYNNYEDVINENVLEEEPMEVFEQPESVEQAKEEPVVADQTNAVPVKPAEEEVPDITGLSQEYYFLSNEDGKGQKSDTFNLLGDSEKAVGSKDKLKPSELLPSDAKDMKGNNFLNATLSKGEQIIGVPTQTQRSRKNYDLRSSPPNPQVEVSPWNMSTMEPDTGRLTFEIGQSNCVSE